MSAASATVFFGYPETQDGIFPGEPLGLAFSTSRARDLFVEGWFNISNFEIAGWFLDPATKTSARTAHYLRTT